jgi:hypothetical protein
MSGFAPPGRRELVRLTDGWQPGYPIDLRTQEQREKQGLLACRGSGRGTEAARSDEGHAGDGVLHRFAAIQGRGHKDRTTHSSLPVKVFIPDLRIVGSCQCH